MIWKINSKIIAVVNGKRTDLRARVTCELYCFLNIPNNALSFQVWADVLLRLRALSLFKSPDFNVLDKEIFLLRKRMISKGFTGMASPVVEISIKPKGKFSSETHPNNND